MKKLIFYVLLIFTFGYSVKASDVVFSETNVNSIFLDQTINIDCSIEASGFYKFELVVTTMDSTYIEKRDTINFDSAQVFHYVYKNTHLNGLGEKLNLKISKFTQNGFWDFPVESEDIIVIKSNIISFSHNGTFNYMKNGAKCIFELNNKYIDTSRIKIFSKYSNDLSPNKKIDLIQNTNVLNSDSSKVFVFYPFISTIGEVQFFMSFNGDTLNTISFRIGFDGINFTVDTLIDKLNKSNKILVSKDSVIAFLKDSLTSINKDTMKVIVKWIDETSSVEYFNIRDLKQNLAFESDKSNLVLNYSKINLDSAKTFMFKIYNMNGNLVYDSKTWFYNISSISFPELVENYYYFVFYQDNKEMRWIYVIVK